MKKFRITYESIQTIVSEVEADNRWQASENIKIGDTLSEEIISEELSDEGLWDIEEIDGDDFYEDEEIE